MARFVRILFLILLAVACSTDGESVLGSLENAVKDRVIVRDNVIACAASNEKDDMVSIYVYPRDGVSNLRYFETETAEVDKNNFSAYMEYLPPLLNVFNGYLKRFEIEVSQEKWVIVTFDESGKTHLSNPIRLKQNTKPTEYLPQNVSVSDSANTPIFSWHDGRYDDTEIYFQVVSDVQGNLLSGTYTFEKIFQYYQLDNVVLNITKISPPTLKMNTSYNFTLLAVSEDNWVNLLSEISFDLN
ncbi:MAG: hypothetical protein QM485_12735 [Flavobacteriaceae bacterium]